VLKIFADPDPGLENFADPDPGFDFSKNLVL